jgi:diguanylate cyclase (GGDEF)-like protein
MTPGPPLIGILINTASEYFTRILSSIQQELAAGGYASMVLLGRELEPKYPGFLAANDLYGLINGRFDGLIVNTETLCHNLNPEQTLAFLKQFSLPIVCMGREVVGYPAVTLDNTSGMSELMDHLLEVRGFRRLAFVRGAKGNRDSDEREAVFRDALARRGLELPPEHILDGRFYPPQAHEQVEHFVQHHRLPEVFVCANDAMAFAAIGALKKQGYAVPEAVAVTGFDNLERSRFSGPALTTVEQPLGAVGSAVARLMMKQLEGAEPPSVKLPTRLVVRRSCGSQDTASPLNAEQVSSLMEPYIAQNELVNWLQDVELSHTTAASVPDLLRQVSLDLGFMGVRQCFITLYPQPSPKPTPTMHLALSHPVTEHASPTLFPTEAWLPDEVLGGIGASMLFVCPLYLGQTHFGLLFVDMPPELTLHVETLRSQISMGINNIHHTQSLRAYAGQLEQGIQERTRELRQEVEERRKVEDQLRRANLRLEQAATTDDLTRLSNRRHFDTFSRVQWNIHQRLQNPLSLLLCDIDFFKQYNDCYGHLQGDECLRAVGRMLGQCVPRSSDMVARYGGEEFVVLLSDTDIAGAQAVAQRIQESLKALAIPHARSPISPHLTMSIGIANHVPLPGEAIEQAIAAADACLYQAKHQGRNSTVTLEGNSSNRAVLVE